MATITRSIDLSFESDYAPTLVAFLEAKFLDEADASGNGSVTNTEALDWFEARAQDVVSTFHGRAIKWAEENNRGVLPATHQAALTAKDNSDAALKAIQDAAKP